MHSITSGSWVSFCVLERNATMSVGVNIYYIGVNGMVKVCGVDGFRRYGGLRAGIHTRRRRPEL